MIECIFSIDYEIYGNGQGSLMELVYEPSQRLADTFRKADARFVPFVEVAELEAIEARGTDGAVNLVRQQIREFYKEGFAPGLHLHPQWYNAQYVNGQWQLHYDEYNLCTLPRERIVQIVDRAIDYFRGVVGVSDYSPLAFRAGNWLFQPTATAAEVLFERGVRIDSSVFKGGLRREHQLDYRRAPDGYYWRFSERADVAEPRGAWLELPIFTQMVPFWKMSSAKRLSMERQSLAVTRTRGKSLYRLRDSLRFLHPLKFDFCRMTIDELTRMMDKVIENDRETPTVLKPLVAIGHTKELVDFETIERFLSYLKSHGIATSTFDDIYRKCV
jgi:hypothetical protein